MRYGQKLGLYDPFLYKLVDAVFAHMKSFYPSLEEKTAFVSKMIRSEEEKFIKTLNSGEQILDSMIENSKVLSGEDAFKLYDTYGFPIELTAEIRADKGVNVNLDDFANCLEHQKEIARSSRKNLESFNIQSKDLLEFMTPSLYTYDSKSISSEVVGLFKDGVKVNEIVDEGE